MQKIGLLGGLSWVSTSEYYRCLNELVQERLGGSASARIVLESLNHQDYVDKVVQQQDEGAACELILDACTTLEHAGADFIVICCNDVHRFVPELESEVDVPFLHIAEVTAQAVVDRGLKRVGLIGVMRTMEGGFYQETLARAGVETLTPNAADRSFIDSRILDELNVNVFRQPTRAGFLEVIEGLSQAGAEGVILGCTEVPLLLSAQEIDTPSFATTDLHCVAAVDRCLER